MRCYRSFGWHAQSWCLFLLPGGRSALRSCQGNGQTIEYRVECQILRTLHAENALARRFPIGLEEQIKGWSVDDVVKFHSEHYRPDNALLYVVGDVKADDVELAIRTAFDGVPKASTPNPVPEGAVRHTRPSSPVVRWTVRPDERGAS